MTAASEWDYASIGELSDALRSRKMSAFELLEHTIARIEALTGASMPSSFATSIAQRMRRKRLMLRSPAVSGGRCLVYR